jgi:chaperone required for assembly of F1-ATPase
MKRFYTEVSVTEALGVALDARPVRTPAGAPLTLPNAALADAVAKEWRAQGETIDPRAMPMTGLANAAIDRVAPGPAGFAAGLAAYAESDLLCYRAGDPPDLAARQERAWNPILDWARQRYDVAFTLVTGIMHQPQPPATVARLGEAIAARSAFELAALSPIVTIAGSLVIGLALVEDALDPAAAFDAAHLDELWQAEQWGEDDLALTARAARRSDFLAACRFLDLLRG